jgi:gamma-glutamylcyclotransferase (GGCT)/AIG2-like uncharacterized protein YtfP
MDFTRLLKHAMFASLFFAISCKHSNPVDFQPEAEFYLYAANSAKGEVYIIDLETYAAVDTIFNLGDYVRALTMTNDGQKLFVRSDQLYKIDLPSKTSSIIQPYGEVYVSPNNTIFLNASGDLYTIDPNTGMTTQIDTVDVGKRVVFDVNTTRMFGVELHTRDEGSRLVIYDYQAKGLEKTDPIKRQSGLPVGMF